MTFNRWVIVFLVVHFLGMAVWFGYYSKHYACFDYKAPNYSFSKCGALGLAGVWEFGVVEQLAEQVTS